MGRMSVAACLAVFLCGVMPAAARADAESSAAGTQVEQVAATLAEELARLCPVSDPASQAAYDDCRRGLHRNSQFRRQLPDFVLWGRQRDPNLTLKETKLTQFGPDVFTSMYAPLFMFNGKYTVHWIEREKHFQIRLQAAFRNRLPPGQFPYPFWHDAEKWSMYQNANEFLLWWDPQKARIRVAQFTIFGSNAPIAAFTPVTHAKFNGQWMWTDSAGKTQPAVTLFDGLFSANNPYIVKVDAAYRTFALRMRDGQCHKCHVPDNPDGMKKLVLLQTPAHAAAEIRRVLESVRKDKMPLNEFGTEEPLDEPVKSALLFEGAQFADLIDAAKRWEAMAAVAAKSAPAAR